MVDIHSFLTEYKKRVDERLVAFISALDITEKLKESMLYSIKAGGKRLRPILLIAVTEACGGAFDKAMAPGLSLEMLHTYSLIHDDLPAMDDDDLRRGMPTNHKRYGEATAILAGDALLTLAFQCLAEAPGLTDGQKIALVGKLARAAGPEGMVGGQMDDIDAEGKTLDIRALEHIHLRKTGRLLEYAVEAGAIIAEADADVRRKLAAFARHLGIAFQIKDDLLDIEGEEAVIGKRVGGDAERHKNTYPGLLTVEGAKRELERHYQSALAALEAANVSSDVLAALTRYIIIRDR